MRCAQKSIISDRKRAIHIKQASGWDLDPWIVCFPELRRIIDLELVVSPSGSSK